MEQRRVEGGMQAELRAQVQAGMAALQQGNVDDARNIFITLLEVNPKIAVAHVGLGRVFSAEGDHQRALEHFQQALLLKPDFAPAMVFSAEAHEKLGENEDAMSEYEAAVVLDPSLGYGYLKMAQMLVRDDRGEEALVVLRQSVLRSPQDVSLRLMLANALMRDGKSQDAQKEYRRVIDLQPDLWIAHYLVGKLHLQDRDFAAARDALAKATTLVPGNPQVQQALGIALTGLGEHAKAARSFDEALRLKPDNVRYAVKAATARSLTGKHREALDLLLGLGRMSRRSGLVQKAMGEIYLAMGKPEEAVDCFRAMILNTAELKTSAPDVVALAEGPVPDDIAAFAAKLRDALTAHTEAFTEKLRSNPQKVREWRNARGGNAVNG